MPVSDESTHPPLPNRFFYFFSIFFSFFVWPKPIESQQQPSHGMRAEKCLQTTWGYSPVPMQPSAVPRSLALPYPTAPLIQPLLLSLSRTHPVSFAHSRAACLAACSCRAAPAAPTTQPQAPLPQPAARASPSSTKSLSRVSPLSLSLSYTHTSASPALSLSLSPDTHPTLESSPLCLVTIRPRRYSRGASRQQFWLQLHQ